MGIDYLISSFFANNHQSSILNAINILISNISDNAYVFLILAAFLLPFKKVRKLGVGIIVSILFAWIINDFMLKKLIARPRPFETYPEFIPNVLYELPTSKSFPSGHTNVAFAVTAFFWCNYIATKKYLKTSIGITIFAVLVGFSRIYCVHHYFTDVLVGMIGGTCFGIGGYYISKLVFMLEDKLMNASKR